MRTSGGPFTLFIYPPTKRFAHRFERTCIVNSRVPHVQVPHVAILPHALAIGCEATQDCLPVYIAREAIIPSCNDDACGQAFDVPFPWTWERLIKVIEIENLVPFWGGKDAKVVQVRITTQLYTYPRDRSGCQVSCHHDRRSTQKCKRRGRHALKA